MRRDGHRETLRKRSAAVARGRFPGRVPVIKRSTPCPTSRCASCLAEGRVVPLTAPAPEPGASVRSPALQARAASLNSRAARLGPLPLRRKQQAPAASRRGLPTGGAPTSGGCPIDPTAAVSVAGSWARLDARAQDRGRARLPFSESATHRPGDEKPVSADEAHSLPQRSSVHLDSRRWRRPSSQGCRGRRTGPHCWATPPRLLVDSSRFHAYTRSTIDPTKSVMKRPWFVRGIRTYGGWGKAPTTICTVLFSGPGASSSPC